MAQELVIGFPVRLVADLEPRVTKDGKPWVTGRVVQQTRRFDRQTNQWTDGDASFYSISAFGQLAEHMVNSLSKGDNVIIYGQQSVRDFTRGDGTKGSSVEIRLEDCAASVKFNDVQVDRSRKSGGFQGNNSSQNTGGFQGNGGAQKTGGFQGNGGSQGDPWGQADGADSNDDPFANTGASGGAGAGFDSGW